MSERGPRRAMPSPSEELARIAESVRKFGETLRDDPLCVEAIADRAIVRAWLAVQSADQGSDPLDLFRVAESDCIRALDLDSRYVRAWAYRALIAFHHGLFPLAKDQDPLPHFLEADAHSKQALAMAPESAEVQKGRAILCSGMATTMAELGMPRTDLFRQGIACLRRALESEPDGEEKRLSDYVYQFRAENSGHYEEDDTRHEGSGGECKTITPRGDESMRIPLTTLPRAGCASPGTSVATVSATAE